MATKGPSGPFPLGGSGEIKDLGNGISSILGINFSEINRKVGGDNLGSSQRVMKPLDLYGCLPFFA